MNKVKITNDMNYILGYFSILFSTFSIAYLDFNNFIDIKINIKIFMGTLYTVAIAIVGVRLFFKKVLKNGDMYILYYYPIRLADIFYYMYRLFLVYSTLLMSIPLISFALVYGLSLNLIKSIIIKTLVGNSIFLFFVGITFFLIELIKPMNIILYIMESIYTLLLFAFIPLILRAIDHYNIEIWILLIAYFVTFLNIFFVIKKKDRGIFKWICDCVSEDIVYSRKIEFDVKHSDINPYLLVEIKRYTKIKSNLLASIIKFYIYCLFLIYTLIQYEDIKLTFIVANIIAVNNTFSSTSWSSQENELYYFFPLKINVLFLTKVIISSILQLVICIIPMLALVVIQDFEVKYVLWILFLLLPIYSIISTVLDYIIKAQINSEIDVLYGNMPKFIAIIISIVLSNFIYPYL